MTYLQIASAGISIFGVPAFLFVLSESKKNQKIGVIFGLLSNPFWWLSIILTEQWWQLPVHLCYTYGWGCKVYNLWFKK